MARGDQKRQRNQKGEFENIKKKRGNAQKTASKAQKKDLGVPDLRKFGAKLMKQVKQSEPKGMIQLEELAKAAQSRGLQFDADNNSSNINDSHAGDAAVSGNRDNSRKAYYKEFKKVVDQADVILEVLDARDPIGCRTKEVEEVIMNAGSDKKIILILNKIDLVPRETVEDWLKYLRNEHPTIAFKASTQAQRNNLGQVNVSATMATEGLLNASECLGADNLVKLLKNYCRNQNLKTTITVGVIGYPNVGKSSVINSLKRSKVCGVGATPGLTKVAQSISLDKNIKLLDCPGIVFSQSKSAEDEAQVLLRNCVKVELLEDPIAPVEIILSRCSLAQLQELYDLPYFENTNQFLVCFAQKRGMLLRGGVPDVANAARCIIQDWNVGRIPYYTIPPKFGISDGAHVSTEIVTSFGEEFKLEGFNDSGMMDMDEEAPTEEIEPMQTSVGTDSMQVDTVSSISKVATSVPEIRFRQPKKKEAVKKTAEMDEPIFTEEEKSINPQRMQNLRKLAKKQKKAARREAQKNGNPESDAYGDI